MPRAYYNKKTSSHLKLCQVCHKVKSTRQSLKKFKKYCSSNELGDFFISCDMGIFTNQPSRNGFIYTLIFTDHTSKYTWLNGISTWLNIFTYRALSGPRRNERAAKAENQSLFDRDVFEANNFLFHKRTKQKVAEDITR